MFHASIGWQGCFDVFPPCESATLPLHACLALLQDNSLRIWDMRPYAPANRCTKILNGHQHSFEKNLLKCDWSPDGTKVPPPPGADPPLHQTSI